MIEFKNIVYEKKGRIAYLTINRPKQRNAIDVAANQELFVAFHDFKADPDVWIIIVTGAGEVAFSAGADLVAIAEATKDGSHWSWPTPFGCITRDFECTKPMIAAINGFCLGGGMEIALACDIRIAVPHATFGLPEIKVGLLAGGGGTQRAIRSLPPAFAMELLLTGDRYDAETALRFGLISRIVGKESLLAEAEKIAASILSCGPLGVRATKLATQRGIEMSLVEGLRLEAQSFSDLQRTADAKEGPLAFKEKREPNWKGK